MAQICRRVVSNYLSGYVRHSLANLVSGLRCLSRSFSRSSLRCFSLVAEKLPRSFSCFLLVCPFLFSSCFRRFVCCFSSRFFWCVPYFSFRSLFVFVLLCLTSRLPVLSFGFLCYVFASLSYSESLLPFGISPICILL